VEEGAESAIGARRAEVEKRTRAHADNERAGRGTQANDREENTAEEQRGSKVANGVQQQEKDGEVNRRRPSAVLIECSTAERVAQVHCRVGVCCATTSFISNFLSFFQWSADFFFPNSAAAAAEAPDSREHCSHPLRTRVRSAQREGLAQKVNARRSCTTESFSGVGKAEQRQQERAENATSFMLRNVCR
jgi:hypothetical protein